MAAYEKEDYLEAVQVVQSRIVGDSSVSRTFTHWQWRREWFSEIKHFVPLDGIDCIKLGGSPLFLTIQKVTVWHVSIRQEDANFPTPSSLLCPNSS
jgi:hypothetical protein